MEFLDKIGLARLWANITALASTKVDKVDGKDLSTNDFTNEYKDKIDNLQNVTTDDYDLVISEASQFADLATTTAKRVKITIAPEDNVTVSQNVEYLYVNNTYDWYYDITGTSKTELVVYNTYTYGTITGFKSVTGFGNPTYAENEQGGIVNCKTVINCSATYISNATYVENCYALRYESCSNIHNCSGDYIYDWDTYASEQGGDFRNCNYIYNSKVRHAINSNYIYNCTVSKTLEGVIFEQCKYINALSGESGGDTDVDFQSCSYMSNIYLSDANYSNCAYVDIHTCYGYKGTPSVVYGTDASGNLVEIPITTLAEYVMEAMPAAEEASF